MDSQLSLTYEIRNYRLIGPVVDLEVEINSGQSRFILTQAWKQTSGDPSGQTWNYRGITLLYNVVIINF